jgi:hypothetical protein
MAAQANKMEKVNKAGKTNDFSNSAATTMAGTTFQGATMTMGRTSNSSPFRETIARGMVTGVGLLGKGK